MPVRRLTRWLGTILIVTGGFHTVALPQLVEADAKESTSLSSQGSIQQSLIRYSFEQLEALNRTKGWRAAMDAWLALLERTSRWEGAAQQWIAVGEPEHALDALEHCVRARTTYLRFTAQNPYFRSLHNNPRFRQILQTLRLDGRNAPSGRKVEPRR